MICKTNASSKHISHYHHVCFIIIIKVVRFSGDWDFDERKRKLEFDFDMIELLGLIKIKLGRKEVAKIGASTGLGSANNEKLADSGRRAFFDWISADDNIATARGGGGGL